MSKQIKNCFLAFSKFNHNTFIIFSILAFSSNIERAYIYIKGCGDYIFCRLFEKLKPIYIKHRNRCLNTCDLGCDIFFPFLCSSHLASVFFDKNFPLGIKNITV